MAVRVGEFVYPRWLHPHPADYRDRRTVDSDHRGSSANLGAFLRPDFNRSSVPYCLPDLIHFGVGYGNATVGPVVETVSAADPAISVGKTMDHDLAARRNCGLTRTLDVLRAGVRDVNGFVKPASRVAAVQHIDAFGCLVITFTPFWTDRIAA